ncbi:glycine--tRNA ligase [Patescibacteria group bacterium]|nr:glycine--tRNA ligase [Patescibacteria group bacterium]
MKETDNLQQKIVSLCKRRGFVFPGSEIYGGLANTYDYGPLGALMMRNIQNLWWENFVTKRPDIFGLDTAVFMSPEVWIASGHTANFNEVLVDCKDCKQRTGAEKLIEAYFESIGKAEMVEGRSEEDLEKIMSENKIPCPECGKFNWTKPRKFNNLFETHIGIVPENRSLNYLRGELAQGMFVNFKNVVDSQRLKIPFGLAQIGKVFRNEITKGNFIFRTLEFTLMEFEYFFNPNQQSWEELFEYWKKEMKDWIVSLGISESKLRWRTHSDEERSHYSSRTEDLDFEFAVGFKEMFGLAYRTDFDLRNHTEKSGVDLRYIEPETNEKYIPHVVEPTFGSSRIFLALLTNGYVEEEGRVVLKLDKKVAPYRVAVFPLVKNKEELVKKAKEIYENLLIQGFSANWDDRGNIGKRYFAQDEIGTPYCVTVDYQTLEDGTVTIRDRDTMEQERVRIEDIYSRI